MDQKWCDVFLRTSQYLTQIVKCMDNMCRLKPRSSYFSVVTGRFLQPPLPITQASVGLKIPERNIGGTSHNFPSLFVAQSLKVSDILSHSSNPYRYIPYDLYCPSIQYLLSDRICKICHSYFSSLIMLRRHSMTHKQDLIIPSKRFRPQRVAARRQRKLMVIIVNVENRESVDWIDEEELDLNRISILEDDDNQTFPVYYMSENFASPWENKEW